MVRDKIGKKGIYHHKLTYSKQLTTVSFIMQKQLYLNTAQGILLQSGLIFLPTKDSFLHNKNVKQQQIRSSLDQSTAAPPYPLHKQVYLYTKYLNTYSKVRCFHQGHRSQIHSVCDITHSPYARYACAGILIHLNTKDHRTFRTMRHNHSLAFKQSFKSICFRHYIPTHVGIDKRMLHYTKIFPKGMLRIKNIYIDLIRI